MMDNTLNDVRGSGFDRSDSSQSVVFDGVLSDLPAAVWRGAVLGAALAPVVATGWDVLDRALPGGGWPCSDLIEVLTPEFGVLEWRLLGPALRQMTTQRARVEVVLIGPPWDPHVPGLLPLGLKAHELVWVRAQTPAERLWAAEQVIRSGCASLVLLWLAQARPEQIRRLQVGLQASAQGQNAMRNGLVFVFRPQASRQSASAAPLRLSVRAHAAWDLQVQIVKRRGLPHEGTLLLPAMPWGLAGLLMAGVGGDDDSGSF